MSHPIHSKDADFACKWLCESAGNRTASDDAEIAKALECTKYKGKALELPHVDMLARVK